MSLRKISADNSRLERLSRNSTGFKEEFLGPREDVTELPEKLPDDKQKAKDRMLMIVFVLMVIVGLGNKVFNKLMTVSTSCFKCTQFRTATLISDYIFITSDRLFIIFYH